MANRGGIREKKGGVDKTGAVLEKVVQRRATSNKGRGLLFLGRKKGTFSKLFLWFKKGITRASPGNSEGTGGVSFFGGEGGGGKKRNARVGIVISWFSKPSSRVGGRRGGGCRGGGVLARQSEQRKDDIFHKMVKEEGRRLRDTCERTFGSLG